jgi:hypothetical protein
MPNGSKMFCVNGHKIHFPFQGPSKIYPNRDFWSGNPVENVRKISALFLMEPCCRLINLSDHGKSGRSQSGACARNFIEGVSEIKVNDEI